MNRYEAYLHATAHVVSIGALVVLRDGQRYRITNNEGGRLWGVPAHYTDLGPQRLTAWYWDTAGSFHGTAGRNPRYDIVEVIHE